MVIEINTLADVRTFMKGLVNEGVNIHPDDNFNGMVNIRSGENTYTLEEASLRNVLMARAFEVCAATDADIYELSMEIMLVETGLSEFIPLPQAQQE